MSSRSRSLRTRVSQARSSSSLRALASESICSRCSTCSNGRPAAPRRAAWGVGRAQLGVLRLDVRSSSNSASYSSSQISGRRGRSSGARAPPAPGAAPPPASRRRPRSHRGGRARRQHPLQRPAAQAVELAVVGQVEVDRRDRDPPLETAIRSVSSTLLEARLPAVDLVAAPAAPRLLRPASARRCRRVCRAGHLDPVRLAGRAVDVYQRSGGIGSFFSAATSWARKAAATEKSKRPQT